MATDNVFCTECGQEIRREAEVCPNCGVPNERSGRTSNNSSPEAHEWTPLWWLDGKTVAKFGKYYILASLVGTALVVGALLLAVRMIF